MSAKLIMRRLWSKSRPASAYDGEIIYELGYLAARLTAFLFGARAVRWIASRLEEDDPTKPKSHPDGITTVCG